MKTFGLRTWNLDVLVEGEKTVDALLQHRKQLVDFLGMDTADMKPQVNVYPLGDGRGGVGASLYQPFVERKQVFQALTSSFVIFDSWPEHGTFTITLKSCIEFDRDAVLSFIRKQFGRILDIHSWTLSCIRR